MNPVRKVRLGGRREMRPRDKNGPNGFWRFTRHRVRTLVDYQAIAEHPRAPAWAKEHAQRWIDGALAEARRFAEPLNPSETNHG